ncbi:MAG: GIY-YIG nuclease family protein [bacterium]|nr:GIY-YIG nuclease family protein [bacterium]
MAIGKVGTYMSFVYILQSEKNGRYYIGSTDNLARRLEEHQRGKTLSLKNLVPVRLVFSKEYATMSDARGIEAKLKRFKSRKIIERIIADADIETGL